MSAPWRRKRKTDPIRATAVAPSRRRARYDSSPTAGRRPSNRVPAERSTRRASDTDREHTASRLRSAASEGRLLVDQLEHRLAATFSATTYGELDLLVRDLPPERQPERRGRLGKLIPVSLATALALTVAAAVTLLVIAAMAGPGFGRSGAAAPHQPHPRIGRDAVGP